MTETTVIDKFGGFTEIWPCELHEIPIHFRVIRDHWNENYTRRTILEWEELGR